MLVHLRLYRGCNEYSPFLIRDQVIPSEMDPLLDRVCGRYESLKRYQSGMENLEYRSGVYADQQFYPKSPNIYK